MSARKNKPSSYKETPGCRARLLPPELGYCGGSSRQVLAFRACRLPLRLVLFCFSVLLGRAFVCFLSEKFNKGPNPGWKGGVGESGQSVLVVLHVRSVAVEEAMEISPDPCAVFPDLFLSFRPMILGPAAEFKTSSYLETGCSLQLCRCHVAEAMYLGTRLGSWPFDVMVLIFFQISWLL